MSASARPWWAIFSICVTIIVVWAVAMPLLHWAVNEEITSGDFTYKEVFKSEQGNAERPVKKEELAHAPIGLKLQALYVNEPLKAIRLAGAILIAGILAGLVIASIAFRHLMKWGDRFSVLSIADKIAAMLGGIIGISLSAIFLPVLFGGQGNPTITLAGGFIITYICIIALMSMKEELKSYFPGLARTPEPDRAYQQPKILDTNVIIDGRISDVCSAGFIEGQVLIPSFVLEELQHIADSSDSLRRARGRRGLDILNQMRKELDLVVRQCDAVNPENPEEVDVRLVKLAKEIDGSIVTNDFNLNKVAELQGVKVLNINELANALKPVVLPGEEMSVVIIKEGKEINQGVAYLDDGTMVVVEGAKRHIGGTVDVTVASVLQTVAGKMIFANLKAVQEQEDDLIDRNVRNYSGFRARKKTP